MTCAPRSTMTSKPSTSSTGTRQTFAASDDDEDDYGAGAIRVDLGVSILTLAISFISMCLICPYCPQTKRTKGGWASSIICIVIIVELPKCNYNSDAAGNQDNCFLCLSPDKSVYTIRPPLADVTHALSCVIGISLPELVISVRDAYFSGNLYLLMFRNADTRSTILFSKNPRISAGEKTYLGSLLANISAISPSSWRSTVKPF
jgi:hypothetical protein